MESPTATTGLRRRMPSAKQPSTRYNLSNKMMSGHIEDSSEQPLSRQQADAILEQLANNDDNSKKTWSRIVVEKYLSKYAWYWPGKDVKNGPTLSKAWAYYEHVTLPRHLVGDGSADTVLRRAEPGEYQQETELYDWRKLKQATLIEWGTGVDLYFISLRFFAFLMLVCGFMNIPAIMFYLSEEYNGDNPQIGDFLLKGSAVCNNTQWVVCPDCNKADWERDLKRYATGLNATGSNTTLVLRNFCNGATGKVGFANFATIIVVLISLGVFSFYLHIREVRFDEDKATTPDYSVVVENPPPDAVNPDEWKDFFSQFASNPDQVTAVTVALNNDAMIRRLVRRRIFLNQLVAKLAQEVNLEDETALSIAILKYNDEKEMQEPNCISRILDGIVIPLSNLVDMLLPPERLVEKINKLTEEIKVLQEMNYNVAKVFVTFETEEGQRTTLTAMKVGLIDLILNRTGAVAQNCCFQGKVLRVKEPASPTAVRWMDLRFGLIEKTIRRGILLSVTVGMIAIAGLAINGARNQSGPTAAALLTTCFNSTIPQVIKLLMMTERHDSEGSFQVSLYLKITIFRWTLSAILAQIITPFTSTLGFDDQDLLPTIKAILLFDVWLGPLLRLSDWFTNLKKHILAPRTRTQEEMNLSFQGTFYNFGERYTDFTKILFVVFFYSALFPIGFFMGFFILGFQYLVDKFALVRIWSWMPFIGSELAVFSRRFFFNAAALAFCIASSYVFAQFPYDNLCEPTDPETGYQGEYYNVTNGKGESITESMQSIYVKKDSGFAFCQMSWRGREGFSFPPIPTIQTSSDSDLKWMTSGQETITSVYGWFAVLVVIVFFVALFGQAIYLAVVSIFTGNYKPKGECQHIDFSSNPEIFAYVPQIKLPSQPFPYLVCDICDIDPGLIGWNDPAHSYDFYNLIYDVPINGDAARPAEGRRPIYSIIKHYPTKWQIALAESERRNSQPSQ